MRRSFKISIGVFAAALAAALCTVAPAPAATRSAAVTSTAAQFGEPAYFEMTDITRHRFVVKIDDPEEIAHARALVRGETDQLPHVFGRIVKDRAPYNPRWSYHIDPRTVQFFDFSIEVCDATIPYVEEHLAEAGGAFLPGLYWCDWSSRLIREIPPPSGV